MSHTNPFKAQRVTRTATLTLPAPPERVFPLFGPIREAEWAEGWQLNMIYSVSPLGEEVGAVFITQHPGEPDTIWLIMKFDAAAFIIEYARVTPGLRIARVMIQCSAAGEGETNAVVTYQFTALSEAGNAFIQGYSEEQYQHMMDEWRAAVSHTLTTGGRLTHHP